MKKCIALLLCALMLWGCTPEAPPTEPATESPTEQPRVSVTIYHGNENADGFETTEFEVEEMNMNVLVEKLIEVGVLNEDVFITSMRIDGENLILNFGPAFADQLNTMGTSGERMLVGSVVNTFLTAFDAAAVSLRVNGQILESGHVVYDEPMGFIE